MNDLKYLLLLISISVLGCAYHRGGGVITNVEINHLRQFQGKIGKGPVGILSEQISPEQFLKAKKTHYYDNSGLGVYFYWDNAVLCIVLRPRVTWQSPFAVLEAIPRILTDKNDPRAEWINKEWKIKEWKIISDSDLIKSMR